MDEQTVWKGTSSHIINTGTYLLAFLVETGFIALWILFGREIRQTGTLAFVAALIVTVIPFLVVLIKWWQLKATVFEITSERIKITVGILNKRMNTLELYRVKDFILEMPFFLRLFRRGTIRIITSDPSNPELAIVAVPKAKPLLDEIRRCVELRRDVKGVRQLDVDQVDGNPAG